LLAGATDNEVALDTETHDLAHSAIRRVRGSSPSAPVGGEVDPARIAEAGIPELLLMLDHPRFRCAAAVSLAERAGAEHVEALCKAVRKMPRQEVVRAVPAIAKIGEEAGDALIDGLSAKKTFVRHAFSLALGHLKLRRAVVPLLLVLREEQSDVWKDIARVIGTFGNASLRAITRQSGDAKTDERTTRALAHLANHGCEEALVQMTKEGDARLARLAVHALAERQSAREWEEQVLGKLGGESTEPVTLFARRFHDELEGRASESELSAGAEAE
jgi:HEAT repeat protein